MTVAPNMFAIIQSVSNRVEPYHSAFLAAMLKWSYDGDRRLFDSFWQRAAPLDWAVPETNVRIDGEHVLPSGDRIDLLIRVDTSPPRLLGVEVKTREASTTDGQLERYRNGLTDENPNAELAVVYLTPFDRSRAGDAANSLRSVAEFDKFSAKFPETPARHLSWLDIADIPWDGGDLWAQHCHYVRKVISSQEALKSWRPGGGTRLLADFFREDVAERFGQMLRAAVGELDDYILDLARVTDPSALTNAFRVLIQSDTVRNAPGKADGFDTANRMPFLQSQAAGVHRALFALAEEYPNVWLQGMLDYGLRVGHPNHAGGVSLATSRGVNQLEIGRPR